MGRVARGSTTVHAADVGVFELRSGEQPADHPPRAAKRYGWGGGVEDVGSGLELGKGL